MDQNQCLSQNFQFTTIYGKDFLHSQSFSNAKDAQLKSDPYYSWFYDAGIKKQFMNSTTISQAIYFYLKKQFYIIRVIIKKEIKQQIKQTLQHKNQNYQKEAFVQNNPQKFLRKHIINKTEFSNFICLPVINYHQLAKAKNNLSLGKFQQKGKSIYNTSYFNQLDRFIPNQQHLRSQSLELFNFNFFSKKSLPLQGVSTTKSQFSQENAKIREIEKPINFQFKPQFLPSYSQQYISISKGALSRVSDFREQSLRSTSRQLTESENIEFLRNQLKQIN